MSEKDGGQAFPRASLCEGADGMSLRDYFAVHALPSADPYYYYINKYDLEAVARACYLLADAMLVARQPSSSETTGKE